MKYLNLDDESDLNYLKNFILEKKDVANISFGIDSRNSQTNNNCHFVVAVVFHYKPNCGAYNLLIEVVDTSYSNNQIRLMKEVDILINTILKIHEFLILNDISFDIHVDISKDIVNLSNRVYDYANGYITSVFGFSPKFKPESYAAFCVADKYV